jgi:purine catabolism regulator
VLTLAELLDDLELPLIGPVEAAQRPLRWVHISELPDPTPWLSGGELLLSTGMQLGSDKRQRDFVARLASAGVAGLGLGTGFAHAEAPPALVGAAAANGLPLFEVPYELPFIAITEKASTRLVSDHYELLRRSIAAHEQLEALVLERQGLDTVVAAVSSLTGSDVAVRDARGAVIAHSGSGVPEAVATGNGRSLSLPVAQPRAPARLTAVKRGGELTEFDRLILHHAQTIIALELLNRRVAADTERRLAGNVLDAVVSGELAGGELEHRLAPFSIGPRSACFVFAPPAVNGNGNGNGRVAAGLGLGPELVAAFEAEGATALVAEQGRMLCALVDAGEEDELFALAERTRGALAALTGGTGVRAGAGRPVATGEVRRSFHEARCALEASALARGEGADAEARTATYRDLGSFQLLLSLQDTQALGLFCDSVLGPVEAADRGYGDELLRSLEVFIEENGQWERAAKRLYCHRHTLRYRVRRIETLTGRELSSARDRIEFWLALRGRELL